MARYALSSLNFATSRILPVATSLFALGIFVIDTIPSYDFAIAVLYVVVVLLSLGFCNRRGVLLVGLGCVGLTILSYLLSHDVLEPGAALVRCLVSLLAIAITTFLALKILSMTTGLKTHADLLDLTQRLSHTGSFSWNISAGTVLWSEESYRIFALDRGAMPTLELMLQRIHPEDRPRLEEILGRFSHAEPDRYESLVCRLLLPNGWQRHLSISAHAMRDASGAIDVVGAVMDVTEITQAQESLQQTQSALAHVTRVISLGELTASVAHEVNQPLAAIVINGQACLRWLDRSAPDLDQARQAVKRMISEGGRANEVIQRIRTLLRKEEPQKAPLDLNEIVNETLPLIQREMSNHRVLLKLELDPCLPAANGDRIQLQQVIINILVNGIQAMAQVADRPRELLVQTKRDVDGRLLIRVRDSGIGIDADSLPRLFNSFFTTKRNGMGMGLSICRSIIEAHGGRIWASPNQGPGATFQFTLPSSATGIR